MNADIERVKSVFGVSEIKKKEKSLILGSKERRIICFMAFEDENCISLRIKTPAKEIYYFPVNTSVYDTAASLNNMLSHEPAKGMEAWYEKELKKIDEKIIVVNNEDDGKLHYRKGRRRRN